MTKRYPIVYINGFPAEVPSTDRLYNSGNVECTAVVPTSPQIGDLWYDTTNTGCEVLRIYNIGGTWKKVASEVFKTSSEPTVGVQEGDFWYNTLTGSLTMYIDTSWVSMGGGGGGGSVSDILAFSY